MRVDIVGREDARDRLRLAVSDTGVEVVAEARTLAEARRLDVAVDGFLFAADGADRGLRAVPTESLTARELDVLELLVAGQSNKQIAATLGISDQTVKFHVAAICGKFGALNRTDAVRIAIERGLVAL
jgi:DNA-binding NarL/FixJ family response regulator